MSTRKDTKLYRIERPGGFLDYRYGMRGTCELFDIEVKEKRKGLGTELLNELKEKADVIYCFMIEKNRRAKYFYQKNGFKIVARLGGFYSEFNDSDHRDAVMWLWQRHS